MKCKIFFNIVLENKLWIFVLCRSSLSQSWDEMRRFLVFFSGKYGTALNFWNWQDKEFIKRLDLGPNGMIPLEVRFLHNPDESQGYVGCALSGTVFRFYKDEVRRDSDCNRPFNHSKIVMNITEFTSFLKDWLRV